MSSMHYNYSNFSLYVIDMIDTLGLRRGFAWFGAPVGKSFPIAFAPTLAHCNQNPEEQLPGLQKHKTTKMISTMMLEVKDTSA